MIVNPPSDGVPPAVSLSVPQGVAAGMAARLAATASDNVAVAELKFIVDGRTACTLRAAPYVCTWTPTRAGHAVIEVRASDAAGNIAAVSGGVRVEGGLRPEDL